LGVHLGAGLFSDIVNFTELSGRLEPERMLELLSALFGRFDALGEQLGLEKIKTIGDGYTVAGGVPEPRAKGACPPVHPTQPNPLAARMTG
jgi:adenylate cyclase